MELDRDQIKKELALLIDDMPVELHLHSKKTSKFLSFLKSVLTIITTDEQKIKDLEMEKTQLERNLSECEVGYEGTLFLDRAKLHDAEQKIKELIDENERLRATVAVADGERKCRFDVMRKRIAKAKTDTVKKMRKRLKDTMLNENDFICISASELDQIAKEILEGEGND